MVSPLGSPQPKFSFSPLDSIPDTAEDSIEPGNPSQVGQVGAFYLPEIIFGAGSLSNQYNTDAHLASDLPLRTIRLALRYGIRAFDTSAYYGPSEIVLGAALKALKAEFTRSSYKLMTKCGRYGVTQSSFDYSPSTIRASVERSLSRLHTTYLDVVFLHDVEFVCTPVQPRSTGDHSVAITSDTEVAAYGLEEGQEAKVWGDGDQIFLDAIAELRKMQDEGLIKHVGITGYPLPTLLRLALLVLHTPPYKPLDILLSYSHLNLANCTFATFLPHFIQRARITQVITASPLSMGLLTPSPPPWHPAPPELKSAVTAANALCASEEWEWKTGLPNIALGFALRCEDAERREVPMVVGLSTPREVHECIRVWRELQSGEQNQKRRTIENEIIKLFKDADMMNHSWASP